ncbi:MULTISPECIES: hypothetical protein [Streptomycetaceae]|uniref:hypothetical protein n=1 Tax=Streptomycetaceae TaxID=2062 RepID=UPI0006711578|nr:MULTISPECIES: hypothetical protein [Streptomycetaceae]OKI00488.1 hypothetical protein AMK13_32860 [Streptomyces sp. CB02056]
MSQPGATRAQRRALRREVTAFPAVLPTCYPDIAFTAEITATAYPDHLPGYDRPALARLIRTSLRRAAVDAAAQLDPADLPGARDALADHLAGPRPLAGYPDHVLRAEATVVLDRAATEATAAVMRARQNQGVEDAVFLQAARARALALADPAILAAALTMPDTGTWADHLKDFKLTDEDSRTHFTKALAGLSQLLATARKPSTDPTDLQVLEILRTFFSRFDQLHQRRLLVTFTSDYMRTAGHGDLATELEEALDIHDGAESAEEADRPEPAR